MHVVRMKERTKSQKNCETEWEQKWIDLFLYHIPQKMEK